MALMEYCLVNIVLGDNDGSKTGSETTKLEKIFDLTSKVRRRRRRGRGGRNKITF